jgi:uncharacterized protein (TIGR02145 family)
MKTIKLNTMRKLLLFSALIAVSFTTFAQVGIGTTTPDAPAALYVTSTTQGFLPPRMTEAERNAISTPAAGLIVYCTDCGANGQPQFYNGTSWVNMVGGTAEAVDIPSVTSLTGNIWMDRNLGATQVATSSTDAASYGDLYQWGKVQAFTSAYDTATNLTAPVNNTTEAGAFFVEAPSAPNDWLTTVTTSQEVNNTRWNSGTEGAPVKVTANDPCPSGFRVPTETELNAERLTFSSNNAAGAFASKLKLPVAGFRLNKTGALVLVGHSGYYWSSMVSGTDARRLLLNNGSAGMGINSRGFGCSVRCIKE